MGHITHLAERLQGIPAARELWRDHQVAQFTNSITTVRLRLPAALTPVETDVLNMEFPGGCRLMVMVPRHGWPSCSATVSRLIHVSDSEDDSW